MGVLGIYADLFEVEENKTYRKRSSSERTVSRSILEYDDRGRLVKARQAMGGTVLPREMTYNEKDQLVSVYTPSTGKKVTLTYDADGNLIDVRESVVEREWGR